MLFISLSPLNPLRVCEVSCIQKLLTPILRRLNLKTTDCMEKVVNTFSGSEFDSENYKLNFNLCNFYINNFTALQTENK